MHCLYFDIQASWIVFDNSQLISTTLCFWRPLQLILINLILHCVLLAISI